MEELREISRGVHPAILSEGGLGPALRTLVRRSAITVELQVGTNGRLPEPVEIAAYYVVSEDYQCHQARRRVPRGRPCRPAKRHPVAVGPRRWRRRGRPERGSGLIGLRDRVEASGGLLQLESRTGHGTFLVVELPVEAGGHPSDPS